MFWRMVKRKDDGDNGGDHEYDEGRILACFPHKDDERFGGLRGNVIGAEGGPSAVEVSCVACVKT